MSPSDERQNNNRMRNALIERVRHYRQQGSIRADALQIYLLQLGTMGAGIFGSAVVARVLGPEEKGIVDLYRLLSSFLVDFGLLGIGSGLLYYLANQREDPKKIHGIGIIFSLLMGLIVAGIGIVLLPWWQGIFSALSPLLLIITLLTTPFSYYRTLWSNIMTGLNQAVWSYQFALYFAVINVILVLALWQGGQLNAQNLIVLSVALTVINGLAASIVFYRRQPGFAFSWELLNKSLRYGLVVYIGYLTNLLLFRVDQLMINHALGTAALGIYAVSVRWAEMLFVLDNAILAAAVYKISTATADESYALTQRILQRQFVISGVAALGLAILTYPLIYLIYGIAYLGAVVPLLVLLPGVVAWTMTKIISQYISYNRGQQWWPTLASSAGMLVNIGLNWQLIPRVGIVGAGVASTVAYSLVLAITYVVYRHLKVIPVG